MENLYDFLQMQGAKIGLSRSNKTQDLNFSVHCLVFFLLIHQAPWKDMVLGFSHQVSFIIKKPPGRVENSSFVPPLYLCPILAPIIYYLFTYPCLCSKSAKLSEEKNSEFFISISTLQGTGPASPCTQLYKLPSLLSALL